MKFFRKALLVFCFLIAFPLIAFAHDVVMQTVDLGGGYSITVPASLHVKKVFDGEFSLIDTTLTVSVTTPIRLQALSINFPANSNVVDVLIRLANPFSGVQPDRADVEKRLYGTRLSATDTVTDAQGNEQLLVAVTMSDGTFGYLSFAPASGTIASIRPAIDAMITSFDSGGSSTAASGTSSSGGSASVNCTVSTTHANAARLRVGPGTNRGAISFLPINVEVSVTGRIVLSDSSVWYQLDKTQAAPRGTTAAELWVSAEEVTASGDCDHVGQTDAPPVIPIAVAQPTANPVTGGSNPAAAGSPSTGELLPSAGSWVYNINPVVNASCTGTENAPIPATELYDSVTYTYELIPINNDSFEYAGGVFTRFASTNTFNGSFTFDKDLVTVRLDVQSATSMRGEAIDNITYDGGTCNATSEFLTTRN